jgi:hypothetical protein
VCLSGCFSAPPQIVALDPNRGSTSVPADSPVSVTFDQSVVPSSVAVRFSVSPAIPGCDVPSAFSAPSTGPCWVQWLPGQVGFHLLHEQAPFQPATRYEFTLSGGFRDVRGDTNDLDHHWDLTSATAPRVGGTSPSDGAVEVPVDTALSVSFTTSMDPPTTAAAISLEPAVAGTRVVRNLHDHHLFAILPGRMLDPGIRYAITVGSAARGEDNQALASSPAFVVHFTTASRLGGEHAVVLAGAVGEPATEVLLPALAPAVAAQPVAAPVVMVAPRCALPQCGLVASGGPLQGYAAAAIAPDADHVAVVVQDLTASPPTSALEVLDTVHGDEVARFPAAVYPSWSPTGTLVAFSSGTEVDVFDTVTGITTAVAQGAPLAGPPLWSGGSTLVLSTQTGAGAAAASHVELVDRLLGARYDLPSAPPGTVAVAISANGDQIAVVSPQGVTQVVPVGGGSGGVQALSTRLYPVGFAGEGTLVAISHGGPTPQLVRVNVLGGDSTTVTVSLGLPDIATTRLAPDGRRLVFIGFDEAGIVQAFVANADGTRPLALTRFSLGGLQARSVDFAT